MDIILQILIIGIGLPCAALVTYLRRDYLNPVNIIFVFFFVPMFLALFRLSGIQSNEWAYETYVACIATIGAWLILPTLIIFVTSPRELRRRDIPHVDKDVFSSAAYTFLVRSFALLVVAAFFASNYIQAKTLLPLTMPEEAFHLHTEFPSGLRVLARAGAAACVLLYILIYSRRSKFDMLLLAIVFLTPLSRLSRIDLVLSMVALGLMYYRLPLFKLTRGRMLLIGAVVLAVLVGGVEVGNLRQNRMGTYEFKYSDFIKWKPSSAGPAEVYAVVYGYFPLSFENFDAFVRQFRGSHSYVMLSFDWLFTGFIKMNWFPGFGLAQANSFQFTPISSAANVPTALSPFYADAGPIGIIIPLGIYICVWAYLYNKSSFSAIFLALFSFYSGAFALSSFQAIIAAPFIAHQFAQIVIIILVARYFATRERRLAALKMELAT